MQKIAIFKKGVFKYCGTDRHGNYMISTFYRPKVIFKYNKGEGVILIKETTNVRIRVVSDRQAKALASEDPEIRYLTEKAIIKKYGD
jgi:hypothetical protein